MERETIIALYDLYKTLLTEKQRTYFEQYYFYDLSFAEIGNNFDVSRNAVFDQIKKTKDILKNYEDQIELKALYEKLEDVLKLDDLENIKTKIKEIIKE